jgi:hypothetical protein
LGSESPESHPIYDLIVALKFVIHYIINDGKRMRSEPFNEAQLHVIACTLSWLGVPAEEYERCLQIIETEMI